MRDKDILSSMVQNSNHQEVFIQRAAVLCLNQICANLQRANNFQISSEEQDQILGGIFRGLSQISPLTQESLKGVKLSLVFINHYMNNEQVCAYMMQMLVNLLSNCTSQEQFHLCEQIIDILEEILRINQKQVTQYVSTIYNAVATCMGIGV